MDARTEPSQFNLVAFYDRFAALGRAMQRGSKTAALLSEAPKLNIEATIQTNRVNLNNKLISPNSLP
jgi:hypothetical protein